MKTKKISALVGVVLFLIFIWNTQTKASLSNPYLKTGDLTYDDILLIANNSAFGFSSIQAYSLFYVAPFLILLNSFFSREAKWSITRFKSRQQYFFLRVRQILLTAFLFSLTHSVINLGMSYQHFPSEVLESNHFLEIVSLNTISLFLFYSFVGILYELVKDLVNSSTKSFFIVVFTIGLLFFMEKLLLSQIWGPLKDLSMYNKMLEGEWGVLDIALIFIRQFFFAAFASSLGLAAFVRKDMYK